MRIKVAPHYCYDWDGLYVRPWDDEAECCHEKWTPLVWLQCWAHHIARAIR